MESPIVLAKKEINTQHFLSSGAIVVFLMLIFYMAAGIYIEHKKFSFGHEASITIIVGMLISMSQWMKHDDQITSMMQFNDSTFFYVCLPPIVFASGYNMQRAKFFKNIQSIVMFGVLGTIICFSIFSALTIMVKDMGFLTQYNGKTGEWSQLELTSPECLLMCSLLCSSDVIAAISLISYEKEPDLFSIVFGEGITNDAVSIILFNTVMKYTEKNSVISWSTPSDIALNFVSLGAYSIIYGVMFGLLSSFILKQFRMFSKNSIMECLLIFCFGYLSYIASEMSEFSGIITLLTSGIVMAHYTWFNLSPQGKQASYIIFQFLGYANEAFIFVYLGLTFFSYVDKDWSPQLIGIEIFIIAIGRLFGTLGLLAIMKCCCKYKSDIDIRQQIFIWYAGMIRGAIAFGLVLRIDGDKFKNRDVIVTTSLALVVFTTVVYGSTVGVLQKCMEPKSEFKFSESFKNFLKSDKKIEKVDLKDDDYEMNSENDSMDLSEDEESEYEDMLHPNEAPVKKEKSVRKYKGCVKYMHRIDELVMKPMFIYKYEKNISKKSQDFFELFMKQGEEIENEYKMETAGGPQLSRKKTRGIGSKIEKQTHDD